jgi:hypothetical protein
LNERIQKLAEQATSIQGPTPYNPLTFEVFDKEKFAELIVFECQRQVEEQYTPILENKELMKDPIWDAYVQCGVDSYVAIREHFFGVEE